MKKQIFTSLIILFVISSCNNAAKQQAEQQAHDRYIADSVATVITNQQHQKEALVQAKSDLQKSIDSLKTLQNKLKEDWAQTEAKLAAANDNVRSVSEFHLLRSSSERQAEIQSATLRVNELSITLSNIKQQYNEAQNALNATQGRLASMQ